MPAKYHINYVVSAVKELKSWPVYERRKIADAVKRELEHEPRKSTRNKKLIEGETPAWYFEPPLWELRIGECRVFYDVDETNHQVTVRAIRHKRPHRNTGEIV